MATREPRRRLHHGRMHRVPQSFALETASMHRQNEPTSLDLIHLGMQWLKVQTALHQCRSQGIGNAGNAIGSGGCVAASTI